MGVGNSGSTTSEARGVNRADEMNGGSEIGSGGGELRLGLCRWVWQGSKHSEGRSGLETEMGEADIVGDEVTWGRMVGNWREGVGKGEDKAQEPP